MGVPPSLSLVSFTVAGSAGSARTARWQRLAGAGGDLVEELSAPGPGGGHVGILGT
ncbi:Uncharacterised protein [Amycolatopsis camponoti]|uniref:Uncharacterized protein n=1 Tax=Amycolatopsis camponoti TaxID=2606593 RepID=A0A6I8M1R1_9PSEU|nr:Uncharacterised protein [Amycolatopsis camponoti]